MIAVGVINHTPDYMAAKLSQKFGFKRVFYVAPDLPEGKAELLLFLSPYALKRNLDELNTPRFKNTMCVVFGDPIELYDYNLTPLDYALSDDIHLDAFQFTAFDTTALELDVPKLIYKKRDFLKDMREKVTSFCSILTQLMTFLYTIRPSNFQKPVKEVACAWLVSAEDEQGLLDRIAVMRKTIDINDKQIKRFKDILLSESAQRYKAAIQATLHLHYKHLHTDEYARIVSEHEVSAYEIRYIRAVAMV